MSLVPAKDDAPQRLVYLYPGELWAGAEPSTVSTIVGSCVAVFLWDARRRQAGMNHYLLPRAEDASPRFGNVAIRLLLARLAALGSEPESRVAKVFGGAQVLGRATGDANHLGRQNVDVAFELLGQARIPVLAADVGGARGRRVVVHSDDGSAWVKEL